MAEKRIDQLGAQTQMSDADLLLFWKTATGKTNSIRFDKLMESILSRVAVNGLVGKVGSNYFVFKFNESGVLVQTEDLGTTYPVV